MATSVLEIQVLPQLPLSYSAMQPRRRTSDQRKRGRARQVKSRIRFSLFSRYDWPSLTSFKALGVKRSALMRRPGRRPNTMPRLRSISRSNSALCGSPQNADYAEREIMRSHGPHAAIWPAPQGNGTPHNIGRTGKGLVGSLWPHPPRRRKQGSALPSATARAGLSVMRGRAYRPVANTWYYAEC